MLHSIESTADRQSRVAEPEAGALSQLQARMGNQRLLQLRKALQCRNGAGATEPPIPAAGAALPKELEREAERELGVAMDNVFVTQRADEACEAMGGALAFTTPIDGGHLIALSSGVDVGAEDGRFTLLHELAHVAQQRRGQTAALD